MHAANIYSTELSSLGNGHGLWEPNPGNEYRRVEIGDIGFIQAGFFHRLFNALVPADDPSQKWGVPEYYEPLRLPFPNFKFSRHPLLGQLHSTSVKVVSSNLGVTGGPVVAGSAKVSFSCTKERGAALVLPEETIRQDAYFDRWFREYCLQNYRTWLAFANDILGFDLELSDLILVTGCDLTTQWAMAAFAHAECQAGFGFGVSVPGGALSAEFEVRSGWKADQSVQHRCGPQPSRFVESEHVGSSHSQRSDIRNQCVFVRGYRVKERRLFGPKVIRAASGPSDLGSGDRGGDWGSSLTTTELNPETSVEVQSISDNAKDVNLLAPILDHILDESDAYVAIAHDQDMWPYITGIDVLSRETAIIEVDGNHVGRILPKFPNIDLHSPSETRDQKRMSESEELPGWQSSDKEYDSSCDTSSVITQLRDDEFPKYFVTQNDETKDQEGMSESEEPPGWQSSDEEYDDTPSVITQLRDDEFPKYFVTRNGRLFHSHGSLPYPLPADRTEQQRLKLQHNILKDLIGSNYLGPVAEVLDLQNGRQPRTLDLCTGVGTWVTEMADEFRHTKFIGVDIVPICTRYPPRNVQFEVEDVTKPFRWIDGYFDFVHARCTAYSVPLRNCPDFLTEVARVVRPLGLFLSCEWVQAPAMYDPYLDPAVYCPASCAFYRYVARALERRGIYATEFIPRWLNESGLFTNVTGTRYQVPIGNWPGDPRMRELGIRAATLFAGYAKSMKTFLMDNGHDERTLNKLTAGYIHELENNSGMVMIYQVVYARKR